MLVKYLHSVAFFVDGFGQQTKAVEVNRRLGVIGGRRIGELLLA